MPVIKNTVYVYDWKAWSTALFNSICKSPVRIEARIQQSNNKILKKIKDSPAYFLFHINLTKTASFFKNKEELLSGLKDRNVIALNGGINDTSKKYLQQVCRQSGLNTTTASLEGDENELLIIKTNFNYGGQPEKRLSDSAFRRLNLSADRYNTDIIYPVMERKKVKREIWNNENLAVEKYIGNEQNSIYRVYKLLDKIVITEVIEDNVIKKMIKARQRNNYYYHLSNNKILPGGNVKYFDLLTDVIKLSDALKIDFAAIDVTRSDADKYYIIDVNLTPNWNRQDQSEKLDFLSGGLMTL